MILHAADGTPLPTHLQHFKLRVRNKDKSHLNAYKILILGPSIANICALRFLSCYAARTFAQSRSGNTKLKLCPNDYVFQWNNENFYTKARLAQYISDSAKLLKFKEPHGYKGHSCREAPATMLAQRGKSDSFIIQYIQWSNKATSIFGYIRFPEIEFITVPQFIYHTTVSDPTVFWDPTVVRVYQP